MKPELIALYECYFNKGYITKIEQLDIENDAPLYVSLIINMYFNNESTDEINLKEYLTLYLNLNG